MTSPRVAIVGPSLAILGGQSVQAAAIVDGLRASGWDVELVPINPRFPRGLGWLRRWPYLRTLVNQAMYLPSLHRLRRADVVHVFSASYASFLISPVPAMLLARIGGKRVVLNYHSGEADDHLRRWGLLVHPWLRLAHAIVVPSSYLARVFADHGYAVHVIPNVVDLDRFTYRERRPLAPRLLSARNLEPYYRVDVVIDAFARVRRVRPDARLVVAGSGSEERRLRQQAAALGVKDDVRFVGRVEPADMPGVYDASDIFLNASVVDNQPLSILEAFASGLPVVSTPTGDIAAMVRHEETGLVVPPLDARAIADAVVRLLEDEAMARGLARRARREAAAADWSSVKLAWSGVYTGRPTARPAVAETAA